VYRYKDGVLVPELQEWASYVKYKIKDEDEDEDEDVGMWLYEFPEAKWDDAQTSENKLVSVIKNEHLEVTIKSKIYSYQQYQENIKYLRQDYTFKNTSTGTITDFVFIQYMDADVGKGYPDDLKNDRCISEFTSGITLPSGVQLPNRYWAWILKLDEFRGYGLTCEGYPQPDPWYKSWYNSLPDNEKKGFMVGRWNDVLLAVENDMLEGKDKEWNKNDWQDKVNDIWYDGNSAVALRWSRKNNINILPNGSVTISPGLIVVPEPCSMVLMATGLAGLAAGMIRRRHRRG
jgi:hypothetical protein